MLKASICQLTVDILVKNFKQLEILIKVTLAPSANTAGRFLKKNTLLHSYWEVGRRKKILFQPLLLPFTPDYKDWYKKVELRNYAAQFRSEKRKAQYFFFYKLTCPVMLKQVENCNLG